MAISINGKPATGAFVSLTALNESSEKVQRAPAAEPRYHDGATWLQVDDPPVQRLLQRNKIQNAAVYTREGAASALKVSKRAVDQATSGQKALFANEKFHPAYDLEAVRGALPPNVKKAGLIAASGRLVRATVPMAIGATLALGAGYVLPGLAGGGFETSAEAESRKTSALLGIAGATTAAGLLSARGFKDLPIVANAARGAVLGGVVLGVFAVGALRANGAADGEN